MPKTLHEPNTLLSRGPDARRGIILYVALCVLVVLFIVVMSYQYIANTGLRQARRILLTRKAFHLAQMGAAQATVYLKYLNRREEEGLSELVKQLLNLRTDSDDPSCLPAPGTELAIDEKSAIWMLDDQPEGEKYQFSDFIDVTITVGSTSPYQDSFDTLQGTGELLIRSSATFDGITRTVEERREFRLVNLVAPLVSRFTFWLQEVDGPQQFNTLQCDIHGQSVRQPVTCVNHDHKTVPAASRKEEYRHRGWIYIGQPVVLNKASGLFETGEYFHFYNPFSPDCQPGGIAFEDQPANLDTGPFQTCFAYFGYFNAMNMEPDWFRLYTQTIGLTTVSSALRLYGGGWRPDLFDKFKGYSRTLVFGDVKSSFPVYGYMYCDTDGDGDDDELIILNAVSENDWPDRHLEEAPEHWGLPGYDTVFQTYDKYYHYMNEIKVMPFNRTYDYMQYTGLHPPPKILDERHYESSTRAAISFSPEEEREQPVHLEGDLDGQFTRVEANLKAKVTDTVNSPAEFARKYIKDGNVLELDGVVLIESGDLRLPRYLKVRKGGIILTNGHVIVRGIKVEDAETAEPDLPQESLTLCTLTASGKTNHIYLDNQFQQNGFICANLAAFGGEIRITGEEGRPMRLYGTVASRSIDPENKYFKGGFKINYRSATDPSGNGYNNFYRMFIQ